MRIARLARHTVELDDGTKVDVAVAGRGVPLVVAHGFTAEGFLYVQTLSRLVSRGFKVVAVDTAGHGNVGGYADLLADVLDHLGIKRAVVAGHSMGGRVVTEYAALRPDAVIAVVLVDAIVGDAWDRRIAAARVVPPVMVATGLALLIDALSTLPVVKDRRQALKLGRLWAPVWLHNARRPWKMLGTGVSILRSGRSHDMLEKLAEHDVPVYVIHGDRDIAVPLQTARDTARVARGELIVVHGATHSWPLKDPWTLPAIVAELMEGSLGAACRAAVTGEGLPLEVTDLGQIEEVLCDRWALVGQLAPETRFEREVLEEEPPRYTWTRWSPAFATPAGDR